MKSESLKEQMQIIESVLARPQTQYAGLQEAQVVMQAWQEILKRLADAQAPQDGSGLQSADQGA